MHLGGNSWQEKFPGKKTFWRLYTNFHNHYSMRNDFFSQKVAGSKNYLVKVTSRGLLFLSQPITEIFLRTANKRKELKTLWPKTASRFSKSQLSIWLAKSGQVFAPVQLAMAMVESHESKPQSSLSFGDKKTNGERMAQDSIKILRFQVSGLE